MAWTEPVTDRTEEDVLQRRKKGFCNAEDLNRLEENCGWLGEALGVPLVAKEWTREDFPTWGELQRLLSNIQALRDAYYTRTDAPDTPANPLNTWEKWNAAETILWQLHLLWEQNAEGRTRVGEQWSGEAIGLL